MTAIKEAVAMSNTKSMLQSDHPGCYHFSSDELWSQADHHIKIRYRRAQTVITVTQQNSNILDKETDRSKYLFISSFTTIGAES